ncbi:hypothetical protein F5890DRAFT_1480158 [Lentinula detonsa]|uniref:Mid2 domain-containing protein n=1 Tax=Lentinula detonsa TaxID=2804962 RepID=A0AA38UXE1_9AGAR|nr:hypothetical protein F5890DRAFT_1480158 [Lentinula detonsa]
MLLALLSLFYLFQVVAANASFTLETSSLIFSAGWQSSPASRDSLFTDTLGHALTVNIPESIATLNYIGLKRTGGSLYGVCVDCASDSFANLQLFSGHDSTLLYNADAEPATIFSLNVDPQQAHVLQVTNVGDSNFGRESELTFVSIVVQVGSTTSTSTKSSSMTSSSIISSSASIATSSIATSTSTSVAISSDSISSTSSVSGTPSPNYAFISDNQTKASLIAVITVPTVIAVLSLVVGLFFYFRKQRRKHARFSDFTEIGEPQRTQQMQVSGIVPPSSGFLAVAGRQKPATRLPEPYPYDFSISQDGPIFPVRRPETG